MIEADPNGDVVILLGDGSVGVRASSKVLSLASTVFEAMFANRWISDKNPSKAEPATVILPGDHVEKLVLGCGNWRSRGRNKKEATKNNSQNHSSALQSGRNLGIYKQASSVIVQLTLITLGRTLPHRENAVITQLPSLEAINDATLPNATLSVR